MFVSLETLQLDLEATSEDPAVDAALPEIAEDEELLGTLSPSLRKFACLIDRRQKELQQALELLQSLPVEKQQEQNRLLIKLSLTLAAYTQHFYVEVALELERNGRSDVWEKLEFIDFRKGWAVVAMPAISIFVVGPDPEDDDFEDAPSSEIPPSSKKRRLDS